MKTKRTDKKRDTMKERDLRKLKKLKSRYNNRHLPWMHKRFRRCRILRIRIDFEKAKRKFEKNYRKKLKVMNIPLRPMGGRYGSMGRSECDTGWKEERIKYATRIKHAVWRIGGKLNNFEHDKIWKENESERRQENVENQLPEILEEDEEEEEEGEEKMISGR